MSAADSKAATRAHYEAQATGAGVTVNVSEEGRDLAAHAAKPGNATGPWPITNRSLARLRELAREAAAIAASVRDSGPVDVRFEASNLLCGLGDVDELLRDLTIALAMVEAEAT